MRTALRRRRLAQEDVLACLAWLRKELQIGTVQDAALPLAEIVIRVRQHRQEVEERYRW